MNWPEDITGVALIAAGPGAGGAERRTEGAEPWAAWPRSEAVLPKEGRRDAAWEFDASSGPDASPAAADAFLLRWNSFRARPIKKKEIN